MRVHTHAKNTHARDEEDALQICAHAFHCASAGNVDSPACCSRFGNRRMEDVDDSGDESSDVPSRASGDESCGSSTLSKSDDDAESSGTDFAGGQTVPDN